MAADIGSINVRTLIDRRMGPYQIRVFALCFLISLMDGLDSQATSVTGPMMMRDLNLERGALGPILSASQFGALIGAILFGLCADRWGRRGVLIGCGLLFGCATLATAWANSFETLLGLRVLTGLGIGGAVPCYVALASEYAPQHRRAGVVALMVAAIACGGILVGLLGASLLDDYSWRVIYHVCGAVSLVIVLLMIVQMPESLSFMILRGQDPAKIRRVLLRLAPGAVDRSATRFFIDEEVRAGVPIRHLFTESRAPITILLWAAFFVTYFVLIGTLVWTPTLMKLTGMSVAGGSLALTFNNVGAIIGIIGIGQLVDRSRSSTFLVLAAIFLGGAVATALLGYSAPAFWAVAVFSGLAGFFMAAGVSGLYILAAALYPTFMRSTGIGWASAFGRVGASTGPLLVGMMFTAGLSAPADFLGLGLFAAINIVVIGIMGLLARQRSMLHVAEVAAANP
jgi:AAHS family 4-hydroxybenzoate transporter-like MFS transporter